MALLKVKMLFFEDKKLALLHIPKTGGTAVKNFLIKEFGQQEHKELPNSHYRLSEFVSYLKAKDIPCEDINVLVPIRNPMDMLVSYYTFIRSNMNNNVEFNIDSLKNLYIQKISFEEFVVFSLWAKCFFPAYDECLWLPDNVVSPKLWPLRSEALQEDLQQALNSMGFKCSVLLDRVNCTEHSPFENYYTPALAEIVKERHKWYFQR